MAKTPSYRMKTRMIVALSGMIVLGFCVVLHSLFKLQIVQGVELQEKALGQQMQSTRIGAERGEIRDCNGKILAKSATVSSVCISPLQASNLKEEKQKALVEGLSELLDLDQEFITKKMKRTQSQYEVLKTKVERPDADKVTEFAYEIGVGNAIFLEEDTRRYYPYGNFAATVLGFTNKDNVGAYGLESYYNKTLAGTPGRVVSLKNSRGVTMPMQYEQAYDPQNGNTLVLTIDEQIQHYVEKNLETAVKEHSVGERAVGIVMDVKTGQILAMSTKPDFDPNEPYEIFDPEVKKALEEMNTVEQEDSKKEALANAQFGQWRNKAISDPYEPGSVFKIVTSAGALEYGTDTKNSTFYCPGYIEVNGRIQHCWIWASRHKGHGVQTFTQAITNSCNPAFITIGQHLGVHNFSENFANFGLTEGTDIDLPGEAASIYYKEKDMGLSELSSASFGQTFKITSIQLITACSAAVNGGNLMQPYVVKQILDTDENVISNIDPVVKRQVISEETSKDLSLMLEQVVADGSGRKAQIPGYRVGGKTGTSEKIGESSKNILSFFGFAPVEDPKIGCLVMLDEPDLYNAYGSTIAAPIVGSILADTLPYLGIEPQYTQEELDKTTTKMIYITNMDIHEAEADLRIAGLKFRTVGEGTKVVRQIPGAGELIPEGGTVVIYTEEFDEEQMVTVPDVKGKSGSAANQLITDAGLNFAASGEGIDGSLTAAVSQSPAAGETVEPGTIVTVEFATADSSQQSE